MCNELEWELIIQALQKAGGNKTRAAELLGITRRRLYSMMERFKIMEIWSPNKVVASVGIIFSTKVDGGNKVQS